MLVMNGIGRLGQEPEMIQTQSGTSLVNLSLACDSNKKKEDGIGKETIWLNAVAFGKSAEIILQYYHKGYKIYFTGNVQNDKWIDKNTGQQREKIKIIIQYSENLTSRKEAEEMGYTTQPSQYQQSQMQQGYQPNQGQQPQMQQGYQPRVIMVF